MLWTSFLFLFLTHLLRTVSGICFFPVEFQGIFATQSTLTQGDRHRYSEITILPDGIPIWGVCRQRMGNTVILHDSTGGQQCMRCFHLYLRSPNVIQVYTEGIDRCYEDESSATASCPSMQDIRSSRAREIMLYKSRSFNQDGRISRVMCPFVGRYHFSYGAFDGRRRSDMCLDLSSHISSCPRASQVKLSFRDCTFGELDLQLECLGSWTGFDDITYLALFDPNITSDKQPKYRCAMFHETDSGRVSMSLSVDSSCHRQLTSPWQGFESLSLTPFTPPSPPAAVHGRTCNFPDWMQGEWQDIKVKGETLEFRDEATDQLISGRCIAGEEPKGERFALYTVNQCGEESYRCVWIKSRAENVFEFVMSSQEDRLNTSALCSDDRFWKHGWLTQGRQLRSDARCPISGEFIGILPDDSNLCAKLTSDCENPHYMQYTVFPCGNDTVPYEAVVNHDSEQRPQSLVRDDVYFAKDIFDPPRISRRRRSKGASPPWTYLGASEQNNRFYILSSQPVKDDSSEPVQRNTVYVFEGDETTSSSSPLLKKGRSQQEKGTGALVPRTDKLTSNPDQTIDDTDLISEPAMLSHLEDKDRTKRGDLYDVPPGKEKERFYQCLGQWEEGGVTYTYTWRRDVHKHECFAGVVVSDDEVFIIEAGSTCRRGMQPLASGMKIIKRNTCSELEANRNLAREVESNDILNSLDKSFSGSVGPKWSKLGENTLELRSHGSRTKFSFLNLFLVIFISVLRF